MPTIDEIRQQYPQYNDMPDSALADALHSKFYSDMPREDFNQKIGFAAQPDNTQSDRAPVQVTVRPQDVVDATKSYGIGLAKSGLNLITTPQAPLEGLRSAGVGLAKSLGVNVPPAIDQPLPSSSEGIQKSIESVTGQFYKPETPVGEAAQTAGEYTVGLASPGGLVRKVLGGVVAPTVGAEIGQRVGGPIGKTVGGLAGALTGNVKSPPSSPSLETISSQADKGYKAFRAVGASFSPEITNALANSVTAKLESAGAYEHLAKPVHQTIDLLKSESTTSLDKLRSVKEAINSLKVDPDGKISRAAKIASDEINQFLARNEPEAAALLKKADQNYAAKKRTQEIDQAAQIAGLRAGRAGYGGNAVNTMRQVLSPIVESAIKGNPRGYNPEEIRAINDIVVGNTTTNALRGIGQLSPSKGSIPTGIAIATGGISAGIGAVANKLATILTSKQIDRLNELVRKRSPAYEDAVSKAGQKYFSAADEFIANPSQGSLLKATIAARSLANGLSRDGIDTSSGSLLKYLQSPGASRSEDNQTDIPGPPGQ